MSKKTWLFILFLLCSSSLLLAQVKVQEKESDIKAVFIYNFTRYVEWVSNPVENEFVIGILGTSSIEEALTEISKTNTVNTKKIVIKHFTKPDDIANCHILFIPKNVAFPLEAITEKTGKGILTISEEPGFAKKGTSFNFVLVNDKVKFEANMKVINEAGLKVSSQLLKLAIIVN